MASQEIMESEFLESLAKFSRLNCKLTMRWFTKAEGLNRLKKPSDHSCSSWSTFTPTELTRSSSPDLAQSKICCRGRVAWSTAEARLKNDEISIFHEYLFYGSFGNDDVQKVTFLDCIFRELFIRSSWDFLRAHVIMSSNYTPHFVSKPPTLQ